MGEYVGDKPYDFAITVYAGKDTADEAFDQLKLLEDGGKLKIHDAAVFTRTEKGKIKLKNKGYVATGGAERSASHRSPARRTKKPLRTKERTPRRPKKSRSTQLVVRTVDLEGNRSVGVNA